MTPRLEEGDGGVDDRLKQCLLGTCVKSLGNGRPPRCLAKCLQCGGQPRICHPRRLAGAVSGRLLVALDIVLVAIDSIAGSSLLELVAFDILVAFDAISSGSVLGRVALDIVLVAFDAVSSGSLGERVALDVIVVAFDAISLGSLCELVTLDVLVAFDAISGSLCELVTLDVLVLRRDRAALSPLHRLPDATATWLSPAHLTHFCLCELAGPSQDEHEARRVDPKARSDIPSVVYPTTARCQERPRKPFQVAKRFQMSPLRPLSEILEVGDHQRIGLNLDQTLVHELGKQSIRACRVPPIIAARSDRVRPVEADLPPASGCDSLCEAREPHGEMPGETRK